MISKTKRKKKKLAFTKANLICGTLFGWKRTNTTQLFALI